MMRSTGVSGRRWSRAVVFASVLASGLPAARGGCPAIAAGDRHSLALKSDGTVWAWGENRAGQIGNGTTTSASLPEQAKDTTGTGFLTGVAAIAGGALHSLALKDDGSVWAWGFNGDGELGNGTSTDSALPVQVKDATGTGLLTAVIAIASGGYHALALKGDGSVWTWGYNYYGQLGDGTVTDSTLPVQVNDAAGTGFLGGVIAVAGGFKHSLALKGDGSAWAWGYDGDGQLGSGSTPSRIALPVQVADPPGTGFLTGGTAIACGGKHSLAVKGDGSAWAWGYNWDGQLGNGTATSKSSLPVQVKDPSGAGLLTRVIAIAGGFYHSLAVKGDGSAWAWGYNGDGELGNGTGGPSQFSSLPVQVKDPSGTNFLTGVTTAAAGWRHSLALEEDGSVWAWGFNGDGALGDGTNASSKLPVQSSINLGPRPSPPPDQGNVLRAVKRGADVVLTWGGIGTSSWGVYRDPAKQQLGLTAVPPSVSVPDFIDPGRVRVAGNDYYRVKGLSPCGAGL